MLEESLLCLDLAQLSFGRRMALDAKFLVIIAITTLHAWTDQSFGLEFELTRDLQGREKDFNLIIL